MLFNSLHFLVFFPVVLVLYFVLPRRAKLIMLLGASYYFYMCWKAEYAVLILASTLVDYFAALRMSHLPDRKGRGKYLLLSVLVNLGMLFGFKYLNFFNESVRDFLALFQVDYSVPALRVLLPVGISFYTFQTMGYTIDVYRGDKEAERSFLIFALYVSFFPQLVAGPIERSRRLLPQFHQERKVDFRRLVDGFGLILWGYYMKLVVADQIAPYVNRVYGDPAMYTGGHYIVATVLFAWQIFCDFAGYSSIAIGTACMMGYDMMQNFRRPFFAQSVGEFWGRWHVSLMTWFRDYVYKPLRRKGASPIRPYLNLFAVFFLSALWHGANWTFVAWGLVNWTLVAVERMVAQWPWAVKHTRPKCLNLFGLTRVLESVMVVFLFMIPGFFFRSPSIKQSLYMYRHMFDIPPLTLEYLATLILPFTSDYSALSVGLIVVGSIVLLEGVHVVQETKTKWIFRLWEGAWWFRGGCLLILLLLILFLGNFESQSFIYFQF